MALNILIIAAGGAVGAVLRYLMMIAIGTHTLPWATLGVNVLGSFLLACLIEVFAHFAPVSNELRLLLVVGVLGAFTTFSTFSLDTISLLERGFFKQALFYVSASVILSLGAFILGLKLSRFIVSMGN